MAAFYNQGDQNIYKDFQYVPQEKYRLGFTAPTTTPTAAPVSGGITNTNAFTNSGGNSFNQSGNAFGYGSPVSEVNVRTFNPQSNDPTEKIANAQTMYNKAFQDINDPRPSAKGLNARTQTLTQTRPSQEVMDYYGEQIMNNKEQYGAQGQYNSPYDDTVDLGYLGRDTTTSLEGRIGKDGVRRRSGLGKALDFVTDYLPFIGPVKKGAKFIKGMLPDNPNGPGGGTYGIGGLSDDKKAAYNALAGQGMLFNGQNGFKTLTGKNFQATNYVPNQLEMYEKLKDEEELTGFQKKQLQEASAVYKTTQVQKEKQENEAAQAAVRETNFASQGKSDPNDQSRTGSLGRRPGSGGNVTATAANTNKETGTTYDSGGREGFGYGLKEGGRAGYFFGGRVNFKNGGLASIL